jgi:DNA ligase D-like protein (predicted 3'-phosphoesterase)
MIFVVQEHFASHHHFDFRLEMDNVLKSWAVPKGIPEHWGIKNLAVEVEDHPLDYADFQGEIQEGQYGAGKVKQWDKSEYTLVEKDKKKIIVGLRGRKLKGKYVILLFKKEKNRNLWLIFKKKNETADEKN